ncbi:Putative HTH-type transcriptional regulator YwnA [Aquisphaera giovannonii]|uniref:HTH-type transcriptional regulator YwnA n=2 Tax=Aquisphaera giovannonii TaxID=406548 RepID=A0A5B9WAZ3_9BACT|nr:Putative HTH-type transcriptional regulator YwnA [Aquisphaera giovannonii]
MSVGIHILTVLALKRDEPSTSEFLAQSVNTNPVVIRRLLGTLREAGIVDSRTGVGGGWTLRVEPERITLLDILHALEPREEPFGLHHSKPNPECPCGQHIVSVLCETYEEVRDAKARVLKGITVADITRKILDRIEKDPAASAIASAGC